jgi:hypothetical protein
MWVITGTGDIVTVRPVVVVARVDRGLGVWTRGIRPAMVGEENEHALLFRGAGARAQVALDHSLRRQEVLDLLTEHGDIIVFLRVGREEHGMRSQGNGDNNNNVRPHAA